MVPRRRHGRVGQEHRRRRAEAPPGGQGPQGHDVHPPQRGHRPRQALRQIPDQDRQGRHHTLHWLLRDGRPPLHRIHEDQQAEVRRRHLREVHHGGRVHAREALREAVPRHREDPPDARGQHLRRHRRRDRHAAHPLPRRGAGDVRDRRPADRHPQEDAPPCRRQMDNNQQLGRALGDVQAARGEGLPCATRNTRAS